jgi:MinD-like ATPase involved in chromosome partitioning or flagellar assembly
MNIIITDPSQKIIDAYKTIKNEAKKNGLTVRLVINKIFEDALEEEIDRGMPTTKIGGTK